MGLITTYATLQTEAAAMYGNGRTDMTARWPGFIQLCEAEINRILRVNPQTGITTLTSASSVLTVPSDFMAIRSIRQTEVVKPRITVTDIVTIERYLGEIAQTADPEYACEIDGTIYLAPAPGNGVTFKVIYHKKVPSLSDAAPTNWLLTSHPDVYLYGVLSQASVYDHDDGAMSNYERKFQLGLASILKSEAEHKYGDRLEMSPNGGVA